MRRQDILDAIIQEVRRGGIGDRSLRDLAGEVGTSHRMLLHHFGSREGLLTAVVERIEADQRDFLAALATEPGTATVEAMWRRLSDPALWPAERLFFECYARAARGEQPFARLLPGLVDDWLAAVTPLGSGNEARAGARLGLAVFRGLLLDLVGTEDRDGVDRAFGLFLATLDRA